ncbi:unnamed protein product [Polarella glacialis]|uniref:RNA-editing substrate-binding complex 6 protein domain-containing protein n=1 Tax=Polarella glacialis TaxID=89957 RepID=A0A813LE46_POLGL|nr:unnamed protein product [Polarella glacialis]
MISFYDWGNAAQQGASNGSGAIQDPAAQQDVELQAKICQKIQDAVDISDVFNKVAIHAGKTSPKTLVFAAHRIARYCRLRRQDCGTTRKAARWSSLCADIHRGLASLDAQALTDAAWSLSVLSHRDNKILAGICHQTFQRVEDFSPSNLAITAWSFATLAYRDDLVMKRLNRQVLGRLGEFEAQSLANISWALATIRFKDDVLMHHIANEAVRKVSTFSAQHVANTAWSYATLGRRAEKLFEALEKQAVALLADPQVDFVPLDLALCSWAFSWLDHAGPDSALLQSIVPVAIRRLNEFSTQQLANMLWGFDHANFRDANFYGTVIRWCCTRPATFWQRGNGEELVSVMTALRPYASGQAGWQELERLFTQGTLRPLADFLREANSAEGYSQGLRQLRTYHAGSLYTEWLFANLGIHHLGNGDDPRVRSKVEELLSFYLLPPEPQWLPDGYDDDNVKANRAEIPCLLELLDVKARVQPSSHFLALHLSAELTLDLPQSAVEGRSTQLSRNIWRAVPTRPPRRSGLCFVRGEKFEEHDMPDDDAGVMRTAALRDYQRSHHAEVTALTQVTEAIAEMEQEAGTACPASSSSGSAGNSRVRGWVELFVPHYPCSSCTGAMVQFAKKYPLVEVRAGHDDWRHWVRRLRERWDPNDVRQHNLSINARQLRDLDHKIGEEIPVAYRAALRTVLGSTTGIAGDAPLAERSAAGGGGSSAASNGLAADAGGYGVAMTSPAEPPVSAPATSSRQSFY